MARKPTEITLSIELAKLLSEFIPKIQCYLDIIVQIKAAELERLTQENDLHKDPEVMKIRLELLKVRYKRKIELEKPTPKNTIESKKVPDPSAPPVDPSKPLRGGIKGLDKLPGV